MNLKKEVKILKEELTEKEIQLRNKTILDSFFDEYARPPKKTEFVKIGGILNYLQQQTGFELFLKDNGYMSYGRGYTKTFEVYTNDDKEEVLFIGLKSEIVDEFDMKHRHYFDVCLSNNLPYLNKYFIREKKINLNRSYC